MQKKIVQDLTTCQESDRGEARSSELLAGFMLARRLLYAWHEDWHAKLRGTGGVYSPLQMLIYALTSYDDEFFATKCMDGLSEKELAFVDCRGNNLLWYLTYRDDRNAAGGFACPKTVAALLERGVDPNHRNKLGLCWNDVARHVVRPEV